MFVFIALKPKSQLKSVQRRAQPLEVSQLGQSELILEETLANTACYKSRF